MAESNHIESMPIIAPPVYRDLASIKAIQSASIQAVDDETGLVIVLRVADEDCVLGVQRAVRPRYFKSIDGAASVLAQVGIIEWTARIKDWTPKGTRYNKNARSEGLEI